MPTVDNMPFGLARRPFRTTPDTDAYCPLEGHEAALQALSGGMEQSASMVLVTGAAGTGKSLVGVKFLEALPADTVRVMVCGAPAARPTDLLQAILFDLGLPFQGLSTQELRLAVTSRLLDALAEGQRIVLLVDEAHHLSVESLEEIRLLGNVETKSAKALFVALLGQPRLRDLMARPELAGVAQRLAVRCRLDPLSIDDSIRYLRHQIRACGGRPEAVFTDEAIELLASRAGGIPRVLNTAAALAIGLASKAGAESVDAEAVLDALSQLELLPVDEQTLRIDAASHEFPDRMEESATTGRFTQAAPPVRPISTVVPPESVPVGSTRPASAAKAGKPVKSPSPRRKTA